MDWLIQLLITKWKLKASIANNSLISLTFGRAEVLGRNKLISIAEGECSECSIRRREDN